jgi:hypothetical protein
MLKLLFPHYLYSISLYLLSATAWATSQTVIYPSNLYPGISWEIQAPVEQQTAFQYRGDSKPQQWAKPKFNQPRYRPLDAKQAARPIHSYKYRSEIPSEVLQQYYNSGEFKPGILPNNIGQSNNYRPNGQSEFKPGLPDYQPKPLPTSDYAYSDYPSLQKYSYQQQAYPQTQHYSTPHYTTQAYNPWNPQQDNPWNPQQVNPWNPQQVNPWQTSQYMYQNMMQNTPAGNWAIPELPFESQFFYQQRDNTRQHYNQRELPFSPEQVFIVPSNWIQAPTSSYSATSRDDTQFTVYPIEEQLPKEIW